MNCHLLLTVRNILRETTQLFQMNTIQISFIKLAEIPCQIQFQRVNISCINERYLSLIIRIKNKNSLRNFIKCNNLKWINGFLQILVHSLNLFKKVIPVMVAINNQKNHQKISIRKIILLKILRKKISHTTTLILIIIILILIVNSSTIINQIVKIINNITTKANKMQIIKQNKHNSKIIDLQHHLLNLHVMNMTTLIKIQSKIFHNTIIRIILTKLKRIDYLIIKILMMIILEKRLTLLFLKEKENQLENSQMKLLRKSKKNMNNGKKIFNENQISKNSNTNDQKEHF